MKETFKSLDFWGTTTSLLCAVHCAALPFVLSLGYIGTYQWMAHPLFEGSIFVVTLYFVYNSLIKPYFKTKHNKVSFYMAILGLLLVAMHHGIHQYGTIIVVLGGVLIASAHLINIFFYKHMHA